MSMTKRLTGALNDARKAGLLTVVAFAFGMGAGAAWSADAAQPQPGTWQPHKYDFAYMGFTSTYSCDGLADKLRDLLLAAGARADVKSQPGACASGFGRPDKFARATLIFHTLAPSDAAAANAAPASPGGQPAGAPGVWKSVTIADRKPMSLRVGDCELVEQFEHSVLPLFATQNKMNRTSCVPHQESGSVIDLTFDVFTAAPTPGAPPGGKPSG